MRIFTLLIVCFLLFLGSCSKDGDVLTTSMNEYASTKYIKKILPTNQGLWLISSTIEPTSCLNCSSINYVEGLAYSSPNGFNYLGKIGIILDAETDGENIVVVSPSGISKYNTSLESNVIKQATSDEEFKLMDKAADGKLWFLSNKAIFNLKGDKIALSGNFPAIDFEIAADNSFWIATTDTIYHVMGVSSEKFQLSAIYGAPSNAATSTPTIFGLKIDKTDSVWINTPDKVFKLAHNSWNNVKVGNYLGDNFKTIPFMDIDKEGRLWLAEKNYQAFTDLHYYQNSKWTDVKLDAPLSGWITDIESADDENIIIGTNQGLIQLEIN